MDVEECENDKNICNNNTENPDLLDKIMPVEKCQNSKNLQHVTNEFIEKCEADRHNDITSYENVDSSKLNIEESIDPKNVASEAQFMPSKKRVRKKICLPSDDSDSDQEKLPSLIENEEQFNKNPQKTTFFSDSEESENVEINFDNNIQNDNLKHKKNRLLIDSDSEVEDEIQPHEKSFTAEEVNTDFNKISKHDSIITNQQGHNQKSNWSSLCDDDTSEDETTAKHDQEIIENSDEGYLDEPKIKPIKYKRKSKPKNGEQEPKTMTAKEAAQLWKETKSESQRMLRESNVSLPYHKPKSFTLKEFLSKRPKLASAVPIASTTPPSVAIKMSSEQLEIIQKKMKERQKELKKFYKSESESEGDECDKDYIPPQGDKEVEGERGDSRKDTEIIEGLQNANSQMIDEENVADSGIDTQDIVSVSPQETPMHSADNETAVENNKVIDNNASPEVIPDIDSKSLTTEKEADLSQDKEIIDEGGIKTVEHSSLNYDFNLDDLDENIEKEQDSYINQQKISQNEDVENVAGQAENSNGTNDIVEEAKNLNDMKKVSKLELLKDALVNIKPKLSGGPNDVIDLETGVIKPNELTKLMERFVQHTAKRPNNKAHKVQFSVVSVDGGEIHKETVAISVEEDDPSTIEEKPGAKLAKLKDTLQNQMAQRRSELWQKKIDNRDVKEVDDGEKSVCGFDDDILDDDEEEEMSESSEDEVEDEEEYEDTKAQSNKKSSVFLDEEAEVSEVEDNKNDDDETNDDDSENDDDYENDNYVDKDDEEFNQAEVELDEKSKDLVNCSSTDEPAKKTLRRIIKRFTEESDDEDEDNLPLGNNQIENDENMRKNCEENLAENDAEITCHQPQNSETPIKRTSSDNKSMEFLTPISYITGIQNLNNSSSKISPFRVPSVPSPLKESNWHSDLQKKLFQSSEITDSQAEMMAELSSGNIQDSQELSDSQYVCPPMAGSLPEAGEINCSVPPSTQELLGICSGKFSGFSQVSESVDDIDKDNMPSLSDNSQRSNVEHLTFNPNSEVKSLDDDQGMIISQLLDEEEMEKFKRKLQTPTMSNTQRRIVEEFEQECAATGGVIDSDDEDTLEVKKKKQKKLYFSDDENSESDPEEENEEINLHDEIEDDEEEEVPVDNIGYDSEENEIELTDENSVPKLKPSDYFEKEAELSESEWGSDDEDEKDLDMLEAELGDKDKFDETKLKSDLERIHMRRMLADDNKEVKLLQELLLEDGELHGTGRERQFKWKNIDSMNEDGDSTVVKDDDVYLDEEESEEQWRRKRHEREMFLKEKMEKSMVDDNDELLGTSQLLKIGHKVIQKSQQISQGSNSGESVESNDKIDSSFVQCGFNIMSKRGSFLSRSDHVLQRLAEYNKVTTSVAIGTAKNSRNFLFQTVSAPEQSLDIKGKKRKSNDGTPNVIKKLRLSDTLSPALERKVLKKPKAKAKLFGNSRTD